ncbi:radical SAM family RiPP maturation amino acid epimerase [Thiorhodococcus fuscus]|uniref:Radical SAM family RiPP maturation amino acid epimerase n=1 Tax=Thiorhodococcus fuscus TaxID=527200 RepID=A0ABW4Y8C7_9GAMM
MLQKTYLPDMRQQFDALLEKTAGTCQSILDTRHPSNDQDYLSEVAHVKRFLEIWDADYEFRQAIETDPDQAAAGRGLRMDPGHLRYLWDHDYILKAREAQEVPNRTVIRYRAFIAEKLLYRDALREEHCVPRLHRHRVWRERQINRCFSELGETTARAIVHAPFAIELSKGCSVGCWFCGLEAPRKEADFLYTSANAKLWREVLNALHFIIGPNAWSGFLYWASDPLDNPDYEKLIFDYADILGKCPQTTTAQAQKHIERLKPFLRESFARGCEVNRFSVLSLGMLKKLHQAFTAEELLHTELIPQNPESRSMLGKTGRAKNSKHLQRKADFLGFDLDQVMQGTISCVSGFLLNMVERTVKLVSPCNSSERWPHGHWTYEEAVFTDGEDLAGILQGMIDRHMQDSLTHRDPLAFREDLRFAIEGDSFTLTNAMVKHTMNPHPGIQAIGEAIAAGVSTAGEIAFALEAEQGMELDETFIILNRIYQAGLLNEDPDFFAHKRSL